LLTLAEVGSAASVISQAFLEDPLTSFMLPDKRTRIKTLHKFFSVYGEVNIKNHRGYGVGDPLQGVAYWQIPDQENLSVSMKSLAKLVPLLLTFYPIGFLRARSVFSLQDALHTKHASEPHFYLDNIGVLKSARGRGLASQLIRPFLHKADERGVIAYTDTVTASNVALYEHFGFQCVAEVADPRTGITVWALRRTAQ
jgi:ribosomal protein S18 acetylase RimI-like enzyme